MSTPPTWPLPTPERPNPFAPPADPSTEANAGSQSPYGAGYAAPTGYDAAPTPAPSWSPEPQQSNEPQPPIYSQAPGYPPAAPGYGPPQGQAYGYPRAQPQVPSYGYPQGQGAYGYPPAAPGYGYPQPQWGKPQPPMDGLAIASISTSGAGIVTMGITGPVGIGLGIASLRRIRRTGARGRGLAWAGIAVGIVMTLFIAGFIALVVVGGQWSSDVSTGSFTTSTAPRDQSLDTVGLLAFDERLWPGDCLELLPAADLLDASFVDCSVPHAAEVLAYEAFTVAPTASADETAAVFADCGDLASSVAPNARMAGVAASDVWAPSDADWADGVRSGYCMLVSSPGTLTGSALDGTLSGESQQVQS